jgi:hypothetical protein
MLKPHMVVLLNENILHGELLPTRPAHHRFRDLAALLIQQRTVNESVSPGPMGRSPESYQPIN